MAESVLKNSIGLVFLAIKGITCLIDEFNLRNENVLSLHREILQLKPCLETLQTSHDLSGIHNRIQRMIVLLEEIKIWMEIFASKSTLSHFFCALVHKKEINKFYIRIQELKMEMGFEMKVDQHMYQAKLVAQMQQLIESLQGSLEFSKIETLLEFQKRMYELKLHAHLDILHDIDSKYSRLVGDYETELDDMKQRTTTMQQQINVMDAQMQNLQQKVSVIESIRSMKLSRTRNDQWQEESLGKEQSRPDGLFSQKILPSVESSPPRHPLLSCFQKNSTESNNNHESLQQHRLCSENIRTTVLSESKRIQDLLQRQIKIAETKINAHPHFSQHRHTQTDLFLADRQKTVKFSAGYTPMDFVCLRRCMESVDFLFPGDYLSRVEKLELLGLSASVRVAGETWSTPKNLYCLLRKICLYISRISFSLRIRNRRLLPKPPFTRTRYKFLVQNLVHKTSSAQLLQHPRLMPRYIPRNTTVSCLCPSSSVAKIDRLAQWKLYNDLDS